MVGEKSIGVTTSILLSLLILASVASESIQLPPSVLADFCNAAHAEVTKVTTAYHVMCGGPTLLSTAQLMPRTRPIRPASIFPSRAVNDMYGHIHFDLAPAENEDGMRNKGVSALLVTNGCLTSSRKGPFLGDDDDGIAFPIGVHCSRANLTSLPINLPSTTLFMHFGHNSIADLAPDAFASSPNVQHLYFMHNKLDILLNGIFTNLTNLTRLYFNSNLITSLAPGVFRGIHSFSVLLSTHSHLATLLQLHLLSLPVVFNSPAPTFCAVFSTSPQV